MKLHFLIESLGSGGAERQIVLLARQLAKQGHTVDLTYYTPKHFFLDVAKANNLVTVTCVTGSSRFIRFTKTIKLLLKSRPDAIIAFLNTPALLAELTRLAGSRAGIVVSHRTGFVPGANIPTQLRIRLHLHRLADRITTNSHSNRLLLQSLLPHSRDKISTVYNSVDLDEFRPIPLRTNNKYLTITCLARLRPSKGYEHALRALKWATDRGAKIRLNWYGQPEGQSESHFHRLASELSINNLAKLHPPTNNVPEVHANSDALLLASQYEGLPNTVCEGLSSGLPILTTQIGDTDFLVRTGYNGFTVPWGDSDALGDAMLSFSNLSSIERTEYGMRSRARAEALFDPLCIANAYEEIIRAAVERVDGPIASWPSEAQSTWGK